MTLQEAATPREARSPYRWAFGDGGAAEGRSASHTYRTNGTYTATLTVRDAGGAEGKATVRIGVGNTPPEVRITAPGENARFGVGEEIVLKAEATDAEDGALSGDQLSWTALLHHNNDHTHPYLDKTGGREVSLAMPAPEDLAAATGSFLEVRLTATDSGGLSPHGEPEPLPGQGRRHLPDRADGARA